DLLAEGVHLSRLLDALARGIVLPAMVVAAQVIALYPGGRELCSSVGAAEGDDVRRALLPPIEGEVLSHDSDRLGSTGLDVPGSTDRLPEHAQVAAAQRAGPGMDEVLPLFTRGRRCFQTLGRRCHRITPCPEHLRSVASLPLLLVAQLVNSHSWML